MRILGSLVKSKKREFCQKVALWDTYAKKRVKIGEKNYLYSRSQ